MFISVITANYNGGAYLKEAIESVISQDFENFEFIIIDDGSTDDSKEIIESYSLKHDKKIRPIYQKKNSGQGECFNVGIALAKGDVICFLDSDDLWFQGKLRKVSLCFSNQSQFALHQHNLQILRGNRITEERFKNILVTGDYFGEIMNRKALPLFIPTSGLSFRRDVLKKVVPIPKAFVTCADGYLTRTCFCYGEVAADSECLGAYRVHDGNNVFDNPKFNNKSYVRRLLIPNLNRYYRENNIDLRYPRRGWMMKLLDVSPRKVLRDSFSPGVYARLEKIFMKLE